VVAWYGYLLYVDSDGDRVVEIGSWIGFFLDSSVANVIKIRNKLGN
jgi:hypothetical protein